MIINETNLNRNWTTYKLAELGEFSRGKSKHRPRDDKRLFENGKYPLIQTGDISNSNLYVKKHSQMYSDFGLSQSKLWPKGTLCITIAANIAEVAILAYPMCFPDSIVGFNADSTKTSNEFMYYVFKFIQQHIQKMASGSIQDNINIDYLLSLEFKIPTLKEQEAILHSLLTFDNKIENNTLVNDNLSLQIKAIFDYWFNQFDFPNPEYKPYRSSSGKMIWNKDLCKEIPETWKVVPIKNVASLLSGYSFSSNIYEDSGTYRLLTIKNVQDDGINMQVDNFINDVPNNVPDYCRLKVNDILLSLTGNVGRIGIVYKTDCLLNQRVALIKPVDNRIWPFIYALFKSDYIRKKMETIANGSSQKNLSSIETENIFFAYDKETVERFSDKVKPFLKLIVENQVEKSALTELRNWLLPMLMNGQATISD